MARSCGGFMSWVLMIMIVLVVADAAKTPPGIAKNPSNAVCKDPTYKQCHNLVHVCPKFCPDSCTVNCQSCKPVCGPAAPVLVTPSPPPPYYPTPATPTPTPPTPATPVPTPPTPATPTPTPPTPATPTPTPPTPATPVPTPPTPASPVPTPPTPATPTTPSKAKCTDKWYPKCYNSEHVCPSACPGGCEVDCASCKPVCKCDKPGAVCQDPRFIGGDGITFYFHGKKDEDFCLVSDQNLHINAHFIGLRNPNMGRDFTWVQSIAILFGTHQIHLGALKTSSWDDSVDRLAITFDGQPIHLPESALATWQSPAVPGATITRLAGTNSVTVEVEGSFKITARVVPITEQESRVHNYGIVASEDCYAHLDLGFKFPSLTGRVSGVLGQTYRPDYASRVKIGANMPVMGGYGEFKTSSLFAPDCSVSRFSTGQAGGEGEGEGEGYEGVDMDVLGSFKCESGIGGQGVVCKR